jgi:3-deoxy-D-manno-octulosonate 8-phosphate phosphatase (KDO 8-P phosphatase)
MTATLDVLTRARAVRLAAFDVDGVLTDGRLNYGADGETTKAFHTLDGHGFKLLRAAGVEVALITARRSPALARRADNLGLKYVTEGATDKRAALSALLGELGISPHEAAYMGDDFVDLPALLIAGLALTVPVAPFEVKQRAHYVTRAAGGAGAVRETCGLILHAQGVNVDAQRKVAA